MGANHSDDGKHKNAGMFCCLKSSNRLSDLPLSHAQLMEARRETTFPARYNSVVWSTYRTLLANLRDTYSLVIATHNI